MKSLFKTIFKASFALVILLTGALSVYAAGSFLSDPSHNGYGITSIEFEDASNSMSVSIPNFGDTKTFNAYIDYQNDGSSTLYGAKAQFNFDNIGTNNSTTLTGILSGSVVDSLSDDAYLENLPNSWSLDLISARRVNTHGSQCSGVEYEYDQSLSTTDLKGSGASIGYNGDGILSTEGTNQYGDTGTCAQGHVVATFRVENTDQPIFVSVDTQNESEVDTNSARLNGYLSQGNNASVWFALTTNSNPNCSYSSQRVNVYGTMNQGDTFSSLTTGLQEGTQYYYRACAEQDGSTDQGYIYNFYTEQGTNYTYTWKYSDWGQCINGVKSRDVWCEENPGSTEVNNVNCSNSGAMPSETSTLGCEVYTNLNVLTQNESEVDTNSARLNGYLSQGNNASVWFALTTNSNPNCSYSSQRVNVYGTMNQGDTFSSLTTGLQEGTQYYYRACAEQDGSTDQGYIYNFYTEQGTNYTYTWKYSDWGQCINGVKSRDVWCERNDGQVVTPGSAYCSGYAPVSSDTDGCTIVANLDVDTDIPDINNNSVILRGEIQNGSSNNQYFILGDGSNLSCNSFYGFGVDSIQTLYSNQNGQTLYAGGDFSHYISYLNDGDYYYLACAGLDTNPAAGVIRYFNISGDNNYDSTPYAITRNPDNITEDSVELNGRIDMNDYDDGLVFFVYGQDESEIDDVEYENEYSDIDEDRQNIQKIKVDSSLNGDESYDKDVYNLDTDERYYYRICVEYNDENGDENLECGKVEDFRTDDGYYDDNDSEIETRNVDNITESSASICGDLNDDGGDSNLRTWMEYRKASSSVYKQTNKEDRGERYFCETVRNLSSNTLYRYRACSDDACDTSSTFRTSGSYITTEEPLAITDYVYNIKSNSAILPGTYVSNANKASVWFKYGRSENLNKETRRYTKYGVGGGYVHYFTNLASNQRYCYQAVIETVNGNDEGAVKCFYTLPTYTPGPKPRPKPIEEIEPDDDFNIDLSRLGLGLSLVRLEINDDQETVFKGEQLTYEITWENISELDLEKLDLNIQIPREVQITSSSRGKLDQDRNSIVYTINRLDANDRNSMTVTGTVIDGRLGDALTADATIAFDNPVNGAKENAIDYDIDEYIIATALGTASVFGLASITFLGWLTILLGLFIVFLVARWLYLEREELRAQAYVNGYGRVPYAMAPIDNRYDYIAAPQAPQTVKEVHYMQPTPVTPQATTPQNLPENPIVDQGVERTDYRPYRPNRG